MIKALLFDLDGTLLPMDNEKFTACYLSLLSKKFNELGYEGEKAIQAVWRGVAAMVANHGDKTNEQLFWEGFQMVMMNQMLHSKEELNELLMSFYAKEFDEARKATQNNHTAKQLIKELKTHNIKLILATNPIFPKIAVSKRLHWIGLLEEDFADITSYESAHFCKPNPLYYQEILQKHQLQPEQCIMFGNDIAEDMEPASSIGIQTYFINDNPIGILPKQSKTPASSLEQLLELIKTQQV